MSEKILDRFTAAQWDWLLTVAADCHAPGNQCHACAYHEGYEHCPMGQVCLWCVAGGRAGADCEECHRCALESGAWTDLPCRAIPEAEVVDRALVHLKPVFIKAERDRIVNKIGTGGPPLRDWLETIPKEQAATRRWKMEGVK